MTLLYEYDDDGLRTKVTKEDESYIEYTYDNLNRLTDEHAKSVGGSTLWRRQYTYDKVGNRTTISRTDGGNLVINTYVYNDLNQLEDVYLDPGTWYDRYHYEYDANGNLTSKELQHTDGGWNTLCTWTYEWDIQDRLISVSKQAPVLRGNLITLKRKCGKPTVGVCGGNDMFPVTSISVCKAKPRPVYSGGPSGESPTSGGQSSGDSPPVGTVVSPELKRLRQREG